MRKGSLTETPPAPPQQTAVVGIIDGPGPATTGMHRERKRGEYMVANSFRGSITETFFFAAYQAMKVPFAAWLLFIVVPLECLQMLSLALSPRFFVGSGTVLEAIFTQITRLRDPLIGSRSLATLLIGLALFFSAPGMWSVQLMIVAKGGTGSKAGFAYLKGGIMMARIMSIVATYWVLNYVQYSTLWLVISLICTMVFSLLVGIPCTLFIAHERGPRYTPFAMLLARGIVEWHAGKMMMVYSEIAMQHAAFLVHFHVAVVFVLSLALCFVQIFFAPYYAKHTNAAFGGVLMAQVWCALMAVFSVVGSSPSWRFGCGVASLAGIVPLFACGYALSLFRLSDRGLKFTMGPRTKYEGSMYKTSQQYLLASMRVYQHRNDPAFVAKTEELFEEGLNVFPEDLVLKAAYAVFLSDVKNDTPALRELIDSIESRKRPFIDVAMRFYFLNRTIPRLSEELNDVDETELTMANSHRREAKRALAVFWGRLAKKKITTELLNETIRTLNGSETMAERYFHNVLERHPQSPYVLRTYAAFLREIRDDQEQSAALVMEAEACEDRQLAKREASTTGATKQVRMADEPAGSRSSLTVAGNAAAAECGTTSRSRSQPKASISPREEASIDGSISSTHSGASSERMKVLDYRTRVKWRHRADEIKYRWFTIAIGGYLGVIGAINYGIVHGMLLTVPSIYTAQANAVGVHLAVTTAAMHIKEFGGSIYIGNETSVSALRKDAGSFSAHMSGCFNGSTTRAYGSWALPVNVSLMFGSNVREVYQNTSLWNAAVWFHSQVDAMASSSDHRASHYIVSNHRTIGEGFIAVAKSMAGESAELMRYLGNAQLFLGLSGVFVAGVLVCIFLVTVYREFRNRMARGIELLKLVPKTVCINISDKLASDESEDELNEKSKLFSGFSSNDALAAFFISSIAVFFVLNLSLFLFVRFGAGKFNHADDAIIAAGSRQIVAADIQLRADILATATTAAEITDAKQRIVEGILKSNDVLSDLRRALEVAGDAGDDVWFEGRACPGSVGVDCRGIAALLSFYLDAAEGIVKVQNSTRIPELAGRMRAMHSVLALWLQESFDAFLARVLKKFSTTESISLVQFLIGVFGCLTLIAIFFSLATDVASTNIRMTELLLLVPHESMPDAFRDFFESGISTRKEKEEMEVREKRVKMILEGCSDAVFLLDETGLIDDCNPAAEALIGVKSEALCSHSLSKYLTGIGMKFQSAIEEAVERVRSGESRTKFPLGNQFELAVIPRGSTEELTVLASISVGVVGDKVSFVLFMSDIREIKIRQEALEQERKHAAALLLNMLPQSIATELKESPAGHIIAQSHNLVTIVFGHIMGFSKLSATMDAEQLVTLLNDVYSPWDNICGALGVEKIKTMGSVYMCAAGLPNPRSDHAEAAVEFVLAVQEAMAKLNEKRAAEGQQAIHFTFGANSGAVTAGVIGTRKWLYDIWGDTVNLASRLESNGIEDRLQVSATTYELVKDKYTFESRGKIALKGKGDVETFLLAKSQQRSRSSTLDSVPHRIVGRDDSSLEEERRLSRTRMMMMSSFSKRPNSRSTTAGKSPEPMDDVFT